MACGKPSGDPEAILRAADALIHYASGINDTFMDIDAVGPGGQGSVRSTVDLSVFWRGEAADAAAETMSDYREQLNEYADELRDYAEHLRQYAEELAEHQRCTVWEILIWVFIVVFSVVEIVIGFFFGGIIEGALTYLFGAIGTAAVDTLAIVGTIVLETLGLMEIVADAAAVVSEAVELAATFGRIAINVVAEGAEISAADGALDLGFAGLERGALSALRGVGETLGEVGGDALTTAGDLGSLGFEGASDVVGDLTMSGIRSEVGNLAAEAGTKLMDFLADLPANFTEQASTITYKVIYNTAEWYFQELVIRGIASMDPNSGGFASMWNAEDEQAEVLAIMAGMAVGSAGYFFTTKLLSALDRVLIRSGLDFTESLNSVFKAESAVTWLKKYGGAASKDAGIDAKSLARTADSGFSEAELASIRSSGKLEGLGGVIEQETGEALKDATGTVITKEVFDEVIENVWDYGSILALYPSIRGEDFDWKEFWWYVTYGIIESLLAPPLKHGAGKITKRYVGDIFPHGAESIEKESPILSLAAKNLGDFLIADGISIFRKVAIDPSENIGSFSEYLYPENELEEGELEPPVTTPVP